MLYFRKYTPSGVQNALKRQEIEQNGVIAMEKKFVIRPKERERPDKPCIVTSLRWSQALQEEYDKVAYKSGRSRNELICMALRYALENVKIEEMAAEEQASEEAAASL